MSKTCKNTRETEIEQIVHPPYEKAFKAFTGMVMPEFIQAKVQYSALMDRSDI